MQNLGWSAMTGIKTSNRTKNMVLFMQTSPVAIPFSSIGFRGNNTIRLINFPDYEKERLAEVIRASYPYGLTKESSTHANTVQEFQLKVNYYLYKEGLLLILKIVFRDCHGVTIHTKYRARH